MAVEPLKTSLVADLVELINENLGALLRVQLVTCPDCRGRGLVYNQASGEDLACTTCGGATAVERYTLDHEQLQQPRFGRYIEQFEYKQGQFVPKFRSKDKAFAQLVRMLGLEKAVLEIANAAPFAQTISDDERDLYVDQLKDLAAIGALNG